MKCFLHDGRVFIEPFFTNASELQSLIGQCREAAYKAMNEAGAAHAVYGVKRYDPETGALTEADLYRPAVLLDDAEFDARTAAESAKYPGCLILALNGGHTLTIEASDGQETAAFTATFTKEVHEATITLKKPMAVAGDITGAVLDLVGDIPEDAECTVEATNNANDDAPVWQDVTEEVRSGKTIVFGNHTAVNGAAFNFRVSVKRGPSGRDGYISDITGAFQ